MRFAEQWSWCTIESIRDVTPTIREFRLRPESGHITPYPAGSHIGVSVLIDGQPARRSYSLVENDDAGTYRIAVRLAPDSHGGSRGMWNLRAGARIETCNPSSLLDLDWTRRNYCLIAGGIGITPMTGIAAALRRRNIDAPLHHAVKSRGDAAFLDELSALLGDRLNVYASDEGARLDLEATFRALPDDAIAVICGPMRMLEAARRIWNDLGRAPADLRYETFGSSGLKPTAEFRVRLKDMDTELVVPPNSSMLDALNGAGFEVISDCQRGECGVCAVDVVAVEGEIDHRDVFFSDQQKQDNRKICPCVSRAIGIVTIDTLYRAEAV
ncbi:PDR/VanB family oxidoreductase [Bradyrhizobium sp. LMTR 3]|uniref:PDR/VanB family oxidoreductase n=1 Tax=Bradyrhizobium sp. LMTR 3 TaxID=189873 RepID=UPI000810CD77|nr:PDR/VanB family oxidoreductase [Bradyrhizobium sp. LMTR 3]OCK60799.1 diguanylate cyclase [Bradyrhizobium sp. LMTR 3]